MKMQRLCILMIVLVTLFLNNQAHGIREDPCLQPKETRRCWTGILTYYFDKTFGTCEPTYFDGCGGNANNFESLISCQRRCACNLPKYPGPCGAFIPRYFYNSKSRQCEPFFYAGCQGNGNNFLTLADCQIICESTKYKDTN